MNHARKKSVLRFERMHEPLAPWPVFRRRMIASSTVTFGILAVSLAAGMAGYHWLVGIPHWIDCLYSASMIMGGMGPVGPDPHDDAGKVFASLYAIYSGVMLIASVGLLLAPGLHRLLHHFHIESGE